MKETREALIAAGLAEFAERGLDAPSLDDICARAGKTRGAFYVHFADRDDFLVSVMEQTLSGFLDAIRLGEDATDLADIVQRFTRSVIGGTFPLGRKGVMGSQHVIDACVRSPMIRKRYSGLVHQSMDRIARAVEAGQRDGRIRKDVPAGPLAGALVALAIGTQVLLETGVPFDPRKQAAAVLQLVAAGAS